MTSRLAGAALAAVLTAGLAADEPFTVFDNLRYPGKPDLVPAGLVPSGIVYTVGELKDALAAHRIPDEARFKAQVRTAAAGRPGPLVIDIEYEYLSRTRGTADAAVRDHFRLFLTLARWAKEAAPGHAVGYYGHGLFPEEPGPEYAAETRQLIAAVDAFFPSLYTFGNRTPAEWAEKLHALMAQAARLAPGKPVYPYVWPQYHEGAAKALEFLDGPTMRFELDTAQALGAAGVVVWSSHGTPWKDRPWFQATEAFLASHPQRGLPPAGAPPAPLRRFDPE